MRSPSVSSNCVVPGCGTTVQPGTPYAATVTLVGPVKVLSEGVVQLTLNLYSRSVVLVDPSESW